MSDVRRLYHGSPEESFVPTFGLGNDKHDYGRGFYLTEIPELAREWSVGQRTSTSGWLHVYEADLSTLSVLEEMLSLGELGVQYFFQTPRAFAALREIEDAREFVSPELYKDKFDRRDQEARERMVALAYDEKRNPLRRTFDSLLEEDA